MQEIVSIVLIGISLSMDTFSLSLGIGSIISNKKIKILPLLVGIFHFIMPLFGTIVGIKIIEILSIASNIILGVVLLVLGIHLLLELKKEENININLSLLGMLSFSFSVSIDSFSVGLGITSNYYISYVTFALISFLFTYLGLVIGKYSNKLIGKKANLFGAFLLIILGLYYLFV